MVIVQGSNNFLLSQYQFVRTISNSAKLFVAQNAVEGFNKGLFVLFVRANNAMG